MDGVFEMINSLDPSLQRFLFSFGLFGTCGLIVVFGAWAFRGVMYPPPQEKVVTPLIPARASPVPGENVFFVVVGTVRGAVSSETYTDEAIAQREYDRHVQRAASDKDIRRVTMHQFQKVAGWDR